MAAAYKGPQQTHDSQWLYWHQGLLLQPQHLQHQDRVHRFHRLAFQQLQHDHFWGVAHLEINEAALKEKKLCITAGEFLFRDGTYCCLPGNAVIAQRTLVDEVIHERSELTVYLGLAEWCDTGNNVTEVLDARELADVNTHYGVLSEPATVPDWHGNGVTGEMRPLQYPLALFWETEKDTMEGVQWLPLLKLNVADDTVRLVEHYVPPLLKVSASKWLTRRVNQLYSQLVYRAENLDRLKTRTLAYGSQLTSADTLLLMTLQALGRCVAKLAPIKEMDTVHPRVLWDVLRDISAELFSFVTQCPWPGDSEDSVLQWPDYNHRQLSIGFADLYRLIDAMLANIIEGPEFMLSLQRLDGSYCHYWDGALTDHLIGEAKHFWLVLQGTEVNTMVPSGQHKKLKLSPPGHMATLLAHSIVGIGLTPEETIPAGLPGIKDAVYLSIDTAAPLWQDVVEQRRLRLYWEQAPDNASIKLFAKRGTSL